MNQITRAGSCELEVDRSRFLAHLLFVSDPDAVAKHLERAHAEHPDASHVAYAMILEGDTHPLRRSSDAGEPRGTAGRPVLAVLDGADLINALAIVIRYYGGKKLGTGGLVRAYGGAARGALADATIAPLVPSITLELRVPFALEDAVRRECAAAGASVRSARYSEAAVLVVALEARRRDDFQRRIGDSAAGAVRIEEKPAAES